MVQGVDLSDSKQAIMAAVGLMIGVAVILFGGKKVMGLFKS